MKSMRAKEATSERWTVGALMTPQPITIGRQETLATAHRTMREHRIRHLPVLERGELIGVVTQRDLYFLETLRGVDLEEDIVEDAMTTDTYAVTPDAPISAVAKSMARHRYGCAVVIERGKVAGIFTATDALRLVAAFAPPAPSPRIVDTIQKAPSIGVPTVVVHGDADEIVPFRMGERVAAAIPGARLLRIAGGHHGDLLQRARARIFDAIAGGSAVPQL